MSEGLSRGALGALGWSYAATAVRIAVQAAGGVVLARLMGPRPFGLVAAAWVLVGVASQFVDCGFGSALVQRREVNERAVRFAFTMQALVGLTLSAALAGSAGWLARLLGEPESGPVIAWLALALLPQALGQTSASLLRRELDFRSLQLAQLAATLVGFGAVAVPMAALGFGVMSLVAGQMAQSVLSAGLFYAKVRHPLTPLLTAGGEGMVPFGLRVTATNLTNWAIAGLDTLALTRCFGPQSSGWYNRAQVLTTVPAGQAVQLLQAVLFPAYSRKNDEPSVLRQVYLSSLSVVGLALLPAAAVAAACSVSLVTALYGRSWAGAAGLLVPLAWAMPAFGSMALAGPLLWARNRVGDEMRLQAAIVLLLAAVLLAVARTSAVTMVWCVLAVSVVRALGMTRLALRACGARARDAVLALRGGAALALCAGLAAWVVDRLCETQAPALRLALALAAAGALTAALLWRWRAWLLGAEAEALLRASCERLSLPRWLCLRLGLQAVPGAGCGGAP